MSLPGGSLRANARAGLKARSASLAPTRIDKRPYAIVLHVHQTDLSLRAEAEASPAP
jgi:hypothetical protein